MSLESQEVDRPDLASGAQTSPVSVAVRGPVTRERLHSLVHSFYADVRADPLLGPTFDHTLTGRWEAHLARMVEFWSTAALGSRTFSGNIFGKHTALEGVTPEHVTVWVHLWETHTARLFELEDARELQHTALGIARKLFQGYFGRR